VVVDFGGVVGGVDVVVVVGVDVVGVDVVGVHVEDEVVHVAIGWGSVIGSSKSSISLSNNSSSDTSWSVQVSSTIISVWVRTTHVVVWIVHDKEKSVPRVELEKDLRSYNKALAHVGFIRR